MESQEDPHKILKKRKLCYENNSSGDDNKNDKSMMAGTNENLSFISNTELNNKNMNEELNKSSGSVDEKNYSFNSVGNIYIDNDVIQTQSPEKDQIVDMTNINVPDLNDFEKDIMNHPHELTSHESLI